MVKNRWRMEANGSTPSPRFLQQCHLTRNQARRTEEGKKKKKQTNNNFNMLQKSHSISAQLNKAK